MATNTDAYGRATTGPTSGWVKFAGYLMIIAGLFQAIVGLVAIFDPGLYIATDNALWLLDYTQWGWAHFILGIIVTAAGGALLAGRMWGRILAIILAVISALANFAFIWAYPIWSLLIIFIDVMIIYSVAMHGGRQSV